MAANATTIHGACMISDIFIADTAPIPSEKGAAVQALDAAHGVTAPVVSLCSGTHCRPNLHGLANSLRGPQWPFACPRSPRRLASSSPYLLTLNERVLRLPLAFCQYAVHIANLTVRLPRL